MTDTNEAPAPEIDFPVDFTYKKQDYRVLELEHPGDEGDTDPLMSQFLLCKVTTRTEDGEVHKIPVEYLRPVIENPIDKADLVAKVKVFL